MSRLRDVMDEVVEHNGGRVVTSMNEGDRTIAVFREASSAALAALELHDRVGREAFPPSIDVRLRAAIAVGEAAVVDGVYLGAVVDFVVRLRSSAAPGSTVTSEGTAELLLGLVGRGRQHRSARESSRAPTCPRACRCSGSLGLAQSTRRVSESQPAERHCAASSLSAPVPEPTVSRLAIAAEAVDCTRPRCCA